tara:strand:+ start:3784 stop:4866 length:1083 start_codon:yes stop_codon:yes gene_type:complete
MEYIYRGYFSDEVVNHILQLVERQLENNGEPYRLRKKAYNVMVEGLQNITRHQVSKESEPKRDGIFCIRKQDSRYYISTGNQIQNEDIEELRSMLDHLNTMDKMELKAYYQELLNNGTFSTKGGAGIGLVDMARKSGHKLSYNFVDIDEESKFFYLKICLDVSEEESISANDSELIEEQFKQLNELHNHLMEEDVVLSLRGVFNLENVGDIIESIKASKFKTKHKKTKVILSLMYEMLMNIIHHAAVIDNLDGIPGIFLMSKSTDKEHLLFTSANLIPANQEVVIKDQIKFLNELKNEDLDAYLLKRSLSENGLIKTGQGLIDFRKKTKNKLNYYFESVNTSHSLFALQLDLENADNIFS